MISLRYKLCSILDYRGTMGQHSLTLSRSITDVIQLSDHLQKAVIRLIIELLWNFNIQHILSIHSQYYWGIISTSTEGYLFNTSKDLGFNLPHHLSYSSLLSKINVTANFLVLIVGTGYLSTKGYIQSPTSASNTLFR